MGSYSFIRYSDGGENMKKIIGAFTYLCTLFIAVALIGPINHIFNMSSFIITIGVFISGVTLAGVSIDKLIESIMNHQVDKEEIEIMSQFSKISARSSMIIIIAINLVSLLYSYSGISTIGEPLHGITTGILYSVVADSIIQFVLIGVKRKDTKAKTLEKAKNVI